MAIMPLIFFYADEEVPTQLLFTCLKSTIKTLGKRVKYVRC